ncbi:MAG: preprotein translocase subunit SecE [Nitrosomonas sp.]|nr:preprotein translocase subunit SecE [Nitrosomonas sp.]MDP1951985.1 preprotein translocase subunit SecE [Nitrosomonas sp.]
MNKIKLGLAFMLLAAGIAGFIYLRDSAMVVRVLSVLLGFILAVGIAWFTTQGREFYVYSKESVEETKKVVWPTRKETIQTSGVVFAFVLTMALFLWLVDAGLMSAVKLIMNQEG